MPTTRTVVTSATALALSGALLVGCGTQQTLSAQDAVSDASAGLLDGESLTLSLGLDLDDASTDAVLEMAAAEEESLTPEAVEALLASRLEVTTSTTDGSALREVDLAASTDPADAPLRTAVRYLVDGEPMAELRQVGASLFVRVDIAGIGELVGEPVPTDELVEGAGSLDPSLVEPAEALVAGEWVELDTTALTDLAEEMATPDPESQAEAEEMTEQLMGFLDDAAAVVTREVVVERTDDDTYEITAPLDEIVSGMGPAVEELVGGLGEDAGAALPEDLQGELDAAAQDVAGRTAVVTATVEDERLSSVRMDVAQFLEEQDRADMEADGVTGIPVVVDFRDDGEVEAPEGAVPLDVDGLLESFMGGLEELGGMTPEDFGTSGEEPLPGELPLEEGAEPGLDPLAGMTAEDLGMTQEEFDAFVAEMEAAGAAVGTEG